MKNRRKFARIHLAARIEIRLPGAEERLAHFVDNISEGGLFIKTDRPRPIGTRLSFRFSVKDGAAPVEGKGIVRWVETEPGKIQGMGIQFLELNDAGRQELTRALHQKKKSRSTVQD